MSKIIIGLLIALVIQQTYVYGFMQAHREIEHECKHIGMFYRGERVFECHEKEPKDQPSGRSEEPKKP